MTEVDKKNARLELFFGLTEIHKNWGWFVAVGIALIILGMFAVGAAGLTTMLSMAVFAGILIASGAIQLVNAIRTFRGEGFFLNLLTALFYLIAGILLFLKPVLGAVALTLMLAVFYMASGVSKIVISIVNRFTNWGWMFFNGLVSLILGGLIFMEWPESSLWVIGLFVGIDLLVTGWLWVILGLSAKDTEQIDQHPKI